MTASNKNRGVFRPALFLISVLIILFVLMLQNISKAQSNKVGAVLYVSENGEFIFVSLGRNEIKEGDFVKVYKDSKYIATAFIKTVMGKMSEASIVEKNSIININDIVMIASPQEVPSKEAFYKTETYRDTAISSGKKLDSAQEEPPNMESVMAAEATEPTVKDTQEYPESEDINFRKSKEEAILKLEGQIRSLESFKTDAVKQKSKLQNMEEKLLKKRRLFMTSVLGLSVIFLTFVVRRITTEVKINPPQAKAPSAPAEIKKDAGFEPRDLKKFLANKTNKEEKDLFK
ncbi:MAG: hypothetical protein A2Z72_08050 [Omnitrophica bacterium RBG_13_46_9]|nr:MAG: hypothetical protein A2Z72_08050 [Omnitrophica bacterium RBG_13_46_9]